MPVVEVAHSSGRYSVAKRENITIIPSMRNIVGTCQNQKRFVNVLKSVSNIITSLDGSQHLGANVNLTLILLNVQRIREFSIETLAVLGERQVPWRMIRCVRNFRLSRTPSNSVI